MFYFFDSLADFDAWHNELCKSLGFPKPSVNQKTGEIDKTAPMTEIYTEAIPYENGFIAWSDVIYADGLTPITPVFPEVQ